MKKAGTPLKTVEPRTGPMICIETLLCTREISFSGRSVVKMFCRRTGRDGRYRNARYR